MWSLVRGEGGRKAQKNADIHLLVGSPNLSPGRFGLLERGAMWNSMEDSNHTFTLSPPSLFSIFPFPSLIALSPCPPFFSSPTSFIYTHLVVSLQKQQESCSVPVSLCNIKKCSFIFLKNKPFGPPVRDKSTAWNADVLCIVRGSMLSVDFWGEHLLYTSFTNCPSCLHAVSTTLYFFRGGGRMLYCSNKVIPWGGKSHHT